MNITVPQGLLVFRCNLVTLEDGIMKDFTAGHISNEEGAALFQELSTHFPKDKAQFFPGVGYRNIILLEEKFAKLTCTAPHDITDKPYAAFLPKGELESEMMDFILKCQAILKNSEINKARIKNGKSPATSLWPWSQGPMPKMPSFKQTHGHSGGIVTAVDLLRGLAQLTGLEYPYVEGATGFIDTNYSAKMEASFKILESHDFVYIHIEAPDECGHMGDGPLKTKAIEDFDQHVIKPVRDYVQKNPDTHVLILPDHPTPCRLKTHSHAPVPFVWYTPEKTGPHAQTYDEFSAEKTGIEYHESWELTSAFLKKKLVNTLP
jgi:2,3-bisphosphoglycerate-independent phosphoglycerate mutase